MMRPSKEEERFEPDSGFLVGGGDKGSVQEAQSVVIRIVNNSQDTCREILFNVPTIQKDHPQQVEEKTEE